MALSGIPSAQGVYSPHLGQKNTRRPAQTPVIPTTRESDTVSFSGKAKEMAQKDQTTMATGEPDTSMGLSANDLPLEAFSLPQWYADLFTDYTNLDLKVGQPYAGSNQARYDSLPSKEKNMISEYGDTLTKYFQEELKDAGIRGPVDYYTSIVQNKEKSEEVHQAMKQRLADDPRAMELMQHFGISL
ncbi:MAG: hypothetical protein JEZ12_01410 [Desulfobacterium sp.]|nr:hypothetical protein [Desulfobacterium sp.]